MNDDTIQILNKTSIPNTNLNRVEVRITNPKNKDINFVEKLVEKVVPVNQNKNPTSHFNSIFPELILNLELDHPNCNKVKYVDFENMNIKFYFEEALTNLKVLNKSFDPNIIKKRFSDVIAAVKHLHSNRILHGDIKPSNFLYFEDGRLKICDYGISAIILNGRRNTFDRKMYTKNYRAPEVWDSDKWGFEADIWALGCTFFYMLYGVDLFPIQSNDKCYKSCIKSWELNKDNLIGNTINLPNNWSNPENFFMNCLIIKMCNVNPLYRPNIFEIEKEFLEQYETSYTLSTSPSSICFYAYMERKYEEYSEIIYDRSTFINPVNNPDGHLNNLLSAQTEEYKSLVIFLYSFFTNETIFNNDTYVISIFIANSLTGQKLSEFGITNTQISKLKLILRNKQFNFFNWDLFFSRVSDELPEETNNAEEKKEIQIDQEKQPYIRNKLIEGVSNLEITEPIRKTSSFNATLNNMILSDEDDFQFDKEDA